MTSGGRGRDPVGSDEDGPECAQAFVPTHEDAASSDRSGSEAPPLLDPDIWRTKDGRELTITEMYRPHLGNAQAALSKWLKHEKDPAKRRELKRWRSRMRRELVKREKVWQARRKRERKTEGE
jgi:hypothetical protein